MKDNAVGYIANKLNISKSTASKAIRHCSGVDSDTRQSVLDEIRFINYKPQSECDIYAILPDTPHYFWKELRKGIREGKDETIASVKGNIYTNLRDENAVLSYLDEAEQLNARAIIISALVTPKIHDKLATLTDGRLVLFLSEYHDLTNTFFVGSDSYQDGYLMGKEYLKKYADRKLILLTSPNNRNINTRIEGFEDAVSEENEDLIKNAIKIDVNRKLLKDSKLLPSKLAPILIDATKDCNALCLYSAFGLLQLPLILTKAKITSKTVCMCHDYLSENEVSSISVSSNQNMQKQGETAVKLATKYVQEHLYPEEKFNWIPSVIKTI